MRNSPPPPPPPPPPPKCPRPTRCCETPTNYHSCDISKRKNGDEKKKGTCIDDGQQTACRDKWCAGNPKDTLCPGKEGEDGCTHIGTRSAAKCCKDTMCAWTGYGGGCREAAGVASNQNKCILEKIEVEEVKAEAELAEMSNMVQTSNLLTNNKNYITPTQLAAASPIPGGDYLGVGYDLIYGNPDGDGTQCLDPGFRHPVRAIQYGATWFSRDGRYKVPSGAVAMPETSCSRSDNYENTNTVEQYATSLSRDITYGLSIGIPGLGGRAFSGSNNMKKTKNTEKESNYFRFEAKSYCLKHTFYWLDKKPTRSQLTPPFIDAVVTALQSLDGRDPATVDQSSDAFVATSQAWMNLFQQFGTHYTTSISAGGKLIYTNYVEKTREQTLETSGRQDGVATEGNALIKGVEIGQKFAFSQAMSSQSASANGKEFGKSEVSIFGGLPTGDVSDLAGFATWANTVSQNPVPVKCTLLGAFPCTQPERAHHRGTRPSHGTDLARTRMSRAPPSTHLAHGSRTPAHPRADELASFADFASAILEAYEEVSAGNDGGGTPTVGIPLCNQGCYLMGASVTNGFATVPVMNFTW